MDPLSEVISVLEPRSYFVGGFEIGGEWAIRFGAYEGIKCYAVSFGRCWLIFEDGGEPILVEKGDCVLLPRGLPFRIASDPDIPPREWADVLGGSREGALVKLNDLTDVAVLGGHFQLAGPQAQLLVGLLPPIVRLQREHERDTLRWAFDRMRRELIDARPGSFLIVQQMIYTIFIQALRLHLDESTGIGWLFALSDKNVGAAIAAIHREPARRWTVATLAAEVGMSRSGFAARFRALVGEGPIEYLTRWRMMLAGRSVLRGEPLGTLAHSLGYDSESAFRTAFKRVMGCTPRHHARSLLAT